MKIDRLVSIIMILLEKKRISAQELADTFEVSLRTIYRDIKSINMAGIPICAISGVGGGYEIMPNYKLDKSVFSTADLSAMLMGLSGLSNMMHGDDLVNALAKVKTFVPASKAKEIEVRANQIRIDLQPWLHDVNEQRYMALIQSALADSRLIHFRYVDIHGKQTERIVEPYQLVLKHAHWYIQGYCLMRGDYRLFRISRMIGLHVKEETFEPREYQSPILNIDEMVAPMRKIIRLRVHNSIVDRILDYCTFEQFTPDGDAHYIVDFPFIENDYYYDMLLSFGSRCECLSPKSVRETLIGKIETLLQVYHS